MATGDTPEDPMDVDMECYQPPPRETTYYTQPPPLRRTQKKKIRRRVPLSDGEYYEYDSTTDEVVLEPQPASTYAPSSSTLYNTGAPPNASFQTNSCPNPYSIQASASNDAWWSGWDDFPPTSSHPLPDPSFRSTPLKRPRQGIRRFQYSDGEVIYVSTDDETVDERPEAVRNKRLRSQPEIYGDNEAALRAWNATAPALPSNSNGSRMGYYSPSVPPSSSSLKSESGPSQSNTSQPGRIRLGGGLMKVNGVTVVRHSAPRPSLPSSSNNGVAQSPPTSINGRFDPAYVPPMPGAFYDNDDLYGWDAYANGMPGTHGPGMDYHAPPVNGDSQVGMMGYDLGFGTGEPYYFFEKT